MKCFGNTHVFDEGAAMCQCREMPTATLSIPPRRDGRFRRDAPISHERAKQAALRLIHSHFGSPDHARINIPVDADDDDVVIMDYIEQQLLRDVGPENVCSYCGYQHANHICLPGAAASPARCRQV